MLLALQLLLALTTHAEEKATFTTVFYDDFGQVYLGLSKQSSAKIVAFPLAKPEDKKFIAIPAEVQDKRIVGFLPDRDKFFIVSIEKSGDTNPEVHLNRKGAWKKVGGTKCENFTKAKLFRHQLTFFCEELNKKKKEVVKARTISLNKYKLFRSGVFRFPEFLLRYKNVMLVLEGRAPDWSRLRIKLDDNEVVLEANELWGQG